MKRRSTRGIHLGTKRRRRHHKSQLLSGMLQQDDIALISYPLIAIGYLGISFCLIRDFWNIKKGRGRGQNTAPEIYWFMMVLVIVGFFFGFDWKWALLGTVLSIGCLHPLRKRSKLIDENPA